MTNRPSVTSGLATAAALPHTTRLHLVQMDLDSGTQRITSTAFDVTYGGYTWQTVRGYGTMETIVETPDEVNGLKFTLSGVSQTALAEILTEADSYQGRAVTVMAGFIDGATLHVDEAAWKGRIDVPEIDHGADTATITITAESNMADWQRPRKFYFNHADQQRLAPGDNFWLGSEVMEEKEIVVFSREVMMR